MKKENIIIDSVSGYINAQPPKVKKLLQQLRKTILSAAPDAEEKLSYGMPAYKQLGMLVYFAAHTSHIGFYPFKTAIEKFKSELKPIKGAKGTVRFPFDEPLPLDLVSRMVKFRLKQNIERSQIKQAAKKSNVTPKKNSQSTSQKK